MPLLCWCHCLDKLVQDTIEVYNCVGCRLHVVSESGIRFTRVMFDFLVVLRVWFCWVFYLPSIKIVIIVCCMKNNKC